MVAVSGMSDTEVGGDYSLERCREIRRDIFRLLIERRFGATDNVVVLHVLAKIDPEEVAAATAITGGRETLRVTYKAVGRLTTVIETTLPEYDGCEVRECDALGFLKAEDMWKAARPWKPQENVQCPTSNVQRQIEEGAKR